jgi:hypothetical protein
MSAAASGNGGLTPTKAIRRFDVFAEYSRLERLEKGYAEDEAKGYGIWLAKVVAARRFGKKADAGDGAKPSRSERDKERADEPKFRSVGDELQTDETFDQDIVDRMGTAFYSKVFAPAIAEARKRGKRYEDIRDEIRKEWKPAKRSTRSKAAAKSG